MGHTRLGSVPKTQSWEAVVAAIAEVPAHEPEQLVPPLVDVDAVARQCLLAAEAGLEHAKGDAGLQYAFYLLTQITLAAREPDWRQRLQRVGIDLPENATTLDLTVSFQTAIDDHIAAKGRRTDVSEMAQQAAGEALASLAGPRSVTLFGQGRSELLAALRELSTRKGFARLGQRFFGGFMSRFLNFYLSRVTAGNLGGDRFPQIGDLAQFNDALRLHCEQSARIVRDYCGSWYSKTEFQEGINPENTAAFTAVALKKLGSELKQQRAGR